MDHILRGGKETRALLVYLVVFVSGILANHVFFWNVLRDHDFSSFEQPQVTESMLRRKLPMTGSTILKADWLFNNTNGSFWLPQAPESPISGFQVKRTGNEFRTEKYGSTSGFIRDDSIDIMLSPSFNAGDFLAVWIAPMVAGRKSRINPDEQSNKRSLSVVGSVLHWGIRYAWGPGFLYANDQLSVDTEVVFAQRGPVSMKQALASPTFNASTMTIHPVFGDAGLLMSWFYLPHNHTKAYDLCMLPHYVDRHSLLIKSVLQEWPTTRVIDITAPLFNIMDELVQCKFVLSSSLHGLIFSDSYGIPNAHFDPSAGRLEGGRHKFGDYFGAVQRTNFTLELNRNSSVQEIQDFVSSYRYEKPSLNLMSFWTNCPMHAQAYNRTRVEHMEYAKTFAKNFTELLVNRPVNFQQFYKKLQEM